MTSLNEQERQAKRKIDAMLRSTLEKGNAIEVTDEWWEQQRERLIQLQESASLYAEIYESDRELQGWTEAAIEDWTE